MSTLSLQRSRKLLQEQGYDTWIVEKPYNPYTKKREDLFHLFDVVGIKSNVPGITGIQACGEDCMPHIKKILERYCDDAGKKWPPNPYLSTWLKAGNSAFLWSWRKRGERGKRKTWELKEIEFVLKDGTVVAQETMKGD
jgi:hypothetical protein